MEIRLHGRGGQGGVTCAKIIAAAYARLGRRVQAFCDYREGVDPINFGFPAEDTRLERG
jgi:hypothetical protein